MATALGGDYARDAARYNRLVWAIKESTEKLQRIGRDELVAADVILSSLMPELLEAIDAETAFIARHERDAAGRDCLQVLHVINHWKHDTERPMPKMLDFVGHLLSVTLNGAPVVIAPPMAEGATLIPGLEPFEATSALLLRIETVETIFLVGICNKIDLDDEPFIASDRVMAEHILELAAVSIRVIERQRNEFEHIREIFWPVDADYRLNGRLERIARKARNAFVADAVSIMLWRRAESELHIEASAELSAAYCAQQRISKSMVEKWLWGRALDNNEYIPFVIPDLRVEALGDPDLIVAENLRTVLCAPLAVKEDHPGGPGRFIGVLNIYSKGEPRLFAPLELEFARLFAEQSAIAVQATRRYEQQQRNQAAIQRIGEVTTGEDPEEVWRTIARCAAERTSADYATLIRMARDGSRILAPSGTWYAARGGKWVSNPWRLSVDEGSMVGTVIATRKEKYIQDVQSDTGPFQSVQHSSIDPVDVMSAFCVPLMMDDRALGALFIASERANGFTEHDRDALRLIAPHAAVALRNSNLFEINASAIEFQTKIANVMDPRAQAEQIVANLERAGYDVTGCFMALLDGNTGKIQFLIAREPHAHVDIKQQSHYKDAKIGACNGLIEWVIDNRTALLVENFADDPRKEAVREFCRQGVRSCLIVPMMIDDQISGVLGLRSYQRTHAFDEYDRELLETLAPHIAIVLANSQLYSQKVQGLEAVSQYQQKLSVLDTSKPNDIVQQEIENVYEYGRETIQSVGMLTDHMFIALYDEGTNRLDYPLIYEDNSRVDVDSTETQDASEAYASRKLGQYKDLIEWIIRTGHREPLLFENRRQMEQWQRRQMQTTDNIIILPRRSCCWLGAPMIVQDKLVGVIGLRSFQFEGIFNQNHKEMMRTLASQAAIAVENARRYLEARNTTTVALMGAWGAEIVHDVHRESQNIQWSLRRISRLLAELDTPENVDQLLEGMKVSASELSLPKLPVNPPEPGKPIDIDLAPLLAGVLHAEIEQQRVISGSVEIAESLDDADVYIGMDAQWVRRMLRHLIKNAVRHLERNRDSGRITVRTRVEGGVAKVLVEDNGLGVRKEIRPILFQAPTPHAGERKDERHGRGLMLVRFVTNMHGGNAELEWSRENVGSCFSFSVPVVTEFEEQGNG